MIILTHGLSDGVCETFLLIFHTLLGLQRYRQKTVMFSVTHVHLYAYTETNNSIKQTLHKMHLHANNVSLT